MTATPKRRWFQFSLQALMVLMAVVAAGCGWLKWKLDRKQRERGALAEIAKVGGNFNYDWQYAGQSAPPGPAWLRKLVGDDFFSSVVLVQIEGNHVTDDWLVHLEPLAGLKNVYLQCPRTTDAGLSPLRGMALRELSLEGSGVTDSGLVQLQGQTDLAYLNLGKTRVTDTGLIHLQTLTRLRYLNLCGTRVSDAGVAELEHALPNCRIDH